MISQIVLIGVNQEWVIRLLSFFNILFIYLNSMVTPTFKLKLDFSIKLKSNQLI